MQFFFLLVLVVLNQTTSQNYLLMNSSFLFPYLNAFLDVLPSGKVERYSLNLITRRLFIETLNSNLCNMLFCSQVMMHFP